MPTIKYERLPDQKAKAHFDQKTLMTSADFANVKAYQHALAFTVAHLADQDMLSAIHQAIKTSIDNGTSFTDFKKTLLPYLKTKGFVANDNPKLQEKQLNRRLKIIYQTNRATAFAAGQWQRLQATKKTFPYLEYRPSLSTHKRDEHKAYYGIVRHIDDPIWQSIFPPNAFGCKCFVRPLTAKEAQGKGITPDTTIKELPKPDFDSNFDRLGSLLRLAKDRHGAGFAKLLKEKTDDFMVDLIFQPDFVKGLPTVLDGGFEKRFNELKPKILEVTGGKMANSETVRDLQEKLSNQNNFAVATISPSVQELLEAKTAIIYLSDDNLIKEIARHPKESTIELFRNLSYLIKNADKIIQDNEFSVVYFAINDKRYKITVKTTKSRKALFLGTIFELNTKNYEREINNTQKNAIKNGLATGEDPQD